MHISLNRGMTSILMQLDLSNEKYLVLDNYCIVCVIIVARVTITSALMRYWQDAE